MDNNGNGWINTREAATRLGLPARELYRLIDEGRLPAYNVGRNLRLQAEEVDMLRGSRPPS